MRSLSLTLSSARGGQAKGQRGHQAWAASFPRKTSQAGKFLVLFLFKNFYLKNIFKPGSSGAHL